MKNVTLLIKAHLNNDVCRRLNLRVHRMFVINSQVALWDLVSNTKHTMNHITMSAILMFHMRDPGDISRQSPQYPNGPNGITKPILINIQVKVIILLMAATCLMIRGERKTSQLESESENEWVRMMIIKSSWRAIVNKLFLCFFWMCLSGWGEVNDIKFSFNEIKNWNGCIIKCTGESVEQFQSLMSAGASHHLYRVYARGVWGAETCFT